MLFASILMEITMVTFSGLKFARKIPIFTISGQEPVSLRTASRTAGNVTRAEAGTVRFFSERRNKRGKKERKKRTERKKEIEPS